MRLLIQLVALHRTRLLTKQWANKCLRTLLWSGEEVAALAVEAGQALETAFLAGGGEMGALMRAHDWASTPLGPPEAWPRPLKTAVRLILNTGHPMYIWWGPDLLCFYNDAYRRTLGPERHPGSLGQPGREVWAEIWHLIGHQVDYVMAGRGSTWDENRPVPITRFGRLDEIYWTYSYSPIDDETAPSGVGGVLVVCTETTQAVLAERRRRGRDRGRLRDLADPRGDRRPIARRWAGTGRGAGRLRRGRARRRDRLIEREWNDGAMTSNAGRHRLDDYGPSSLRT